MVHNGACSDALLHFIALHALLQLSVPIKSTPWDLTCSVITVKHTLLVMHNWDNRIEFTAVNNCLKIFYLNKIYT